MADEHEQQLKHQVTEAFYASPVCPLSPRLVNGSRLTSSGSAVKSGIPVMTVWHLCSSPLRLELLFSQHGYTADRTLA